MFLELSHDSIIMPLGFRFKKRTAIYPIKNVN